MTRLRLLLLAAASACGGSSSDSDPDSGARDAAASDGAPPAAHTVYVAGTRDFGADFEDHEPAYWVDGELTSLADGDRALGIAATEAGVVVVGTAGDAVTASAVTWTDGVAEPLDGEWSVAIGVAVSGGDVYVTGTREEGGPGPDATSVYWKNGERQILGEPTGGAASTIAFDGGHRYILANEPRVVGDARVEREGYWLDDDFVPVYDPGEEVDETVSLRDLAVADGVVRVVGDRAVDDELTGLLWTDGEESELAAGARLTAIAVADGHAYVGGTIVEYEEGAGTPVVWVDGDATDLATESDSCYQVRDMAVADGDVYVLGSAWLIDGGQCPDNLPDAGVPRIVLWKNGELATDIAPDAYGDAPALALQ